MTEDAVSAARLAALRAEGPPDDREWWDCCVCCLPVDPEVGGCNFNGTPNRHSYPCEDCEPEDYKEAMGNG